MLPKHHPLARYSYMAVGVLRICILQQSVCDFIRSACIGFWCGWTEPHRVKVRVIRISSSPQPAGGLEKLSIGGFVNYYQTNRYTLTFWSHYLLCRSVVSSRTKIVVSSFDNDFSWVWLQNLTALLMRTDWQCNHCSCKALPVSHPLRFPFHPFCPRPLPLFLSTTTSIDQEATKGTMSHQTLMATSSYSTVHVTILSMLFSFLGGKLSIPGTHQCWQHNVDNSCSFGFVFQFQRKTAWLNYEFRALCSLLKSRKVIRRKVKKINLFHTYISLFIRCQTQVQSLSCLVIFNTQRINYQVYVRGASWFLLHLIFELFSLCCNCLSLRSNQTFVKAAPAAVFEQKYIYKDITQSQSR